MMKEINLIEKKGICKVQNFYIVLAFLLITVTLVVAVRIYYYLIKYRAKSFLYLTFDNVNGYFEKNNLK